MINERLIEFSLVRFYNAINEESGCSEYDRQLLERSIKSIDEAVITFDADGNASLTNTTKPVKDGGHLGIMNDPAIKSLIKAMKDKAKPVKDDRPLFTEDGRPIHVRTPATDVTWKKLHEK